MKLKIFQVRTKNKNDGAATRIYLYPKNETLGQNLVNRKLRPYNFFKKELIPEILEYSELTGLKVRWSQYAGCSCPCSPGFIVEGSYGFDIYVDYVDSDYEAGVMEAEVASEGRAAGRKD